MFIRYYAIHISFKLQDYNGQECSIFYDNHSVIMQTLYNFRSAVISPFLAHKFHYLCFIMEEVIANSCRNMFTF